MQNTGSRLAPISDSCNLETNVSTLRIPVTQDHGLQVSDAAAPQHSIDSDRRLRANLSRLHEAMEKQSKKVAQSLHDEAGQLLAVVHLKLDELASKRTL